VAHFQIPINLPHAARIAERLETRAEALLSARGLLGTEEAEALHERAEELRLILGKYEGQGDPPDDEAAQVADEAAVAGRALVEEVESTGIGEDRLGQMVRNLFECLGMGKEGAEISLRAGENPKSLLRPF